jgi:hypothetical protein
MQWHPVLRRIVSAFQPPAARARHAAGEDAAAIVKLGLTGVVLGSIGGGALVGAALMALVAPLDGRQMRRKIASLLSPEVAPPASRQLASVPPPLPGRKRRAVDLIVEDAPGFQNFDRRAHAR